VAVAVAGPPDASETDERVAAPRLGLFASGGASGTGLLDEGFASPSSPSNWAAAAAALTLARVARAGPPPAVGAEIEPPAAPVVGLETGEEGPPAGMLGPVAADEAGGPVVCGFPATAEAGAPDWAGPELELRQA